VSVISLSLLRLSPAGVGSRRSMLQDLRDGWTAWRSRSWIWITDVKFALFNTVVYAPFLVLGPTVAKLNLGGASAWGIILAAQGAGAVLAGLAILGRRASRPLVVITIAQCAWALPIAALALSLPVAVVAAAAFIAGIGSGVFYAIWATTLQRNVPAEVLSRVSSYDSLPSFALGPLGLAAAGPLAGAIGIPAIMWTGAAWQIFSTLVVIALPQIRHFHDPPPCETRA
jgi:MFS family permease